MVIKGVRVRSLARLNPDATIDREDRNLAQLQLLLLEMAVTHHFGYDRDGEKQMRSASASYQTEKTQKI